MLTQSFIAADKQGISAQERDAMILALGIFERGEIKLAPYLEDYKVVLDGPDEVPAWFNMHYWIVRQECGVVVCAGGLIDCLMGVRLDGGPKSIFSTADAMLASGRSQLHDLFYPPPSSVPKEDYDEITVEQMAQALRSYLVTGDPRWDEVLNPQRDNNLATLALLEGACV